MWGAKRSGAEEAARAETLAAYREALAQHEREIQHLLGIIVEMKQSGFMPPTRPEQLADVEPLIPDDVEMAIRQRSGPGTDLERDLRQWAAQQLRNGAQPENVVHAVIQGSEEEE